MWYNTSKRGQDNDRLIDRLIDYLLGIGVNLGKKRKGAHSCNLQVTISCCFVCTNNYCTKLTFYFPYFLRISCWEDYLVYDLGEILDHDIVWWSLYLFKRVISDGSQVHLFPSWLHPIFFNHLLSYVHYFILYYFIIFLVSRNVGMSSSTSAARIGSFLSPYVIFLVSTAQQLVLKIA